MAKKFDTIFLSEMYMRTYDFDVTKMMERYIHEILQHTRSKSLDEMVVVANPMLKYEVITRISTKVIQSIAIRVKEVIITGICVSSKVKE